MNRPGEFDAASRKLHDKLSAGVTDALKMTIAVGDTIRELGEIPEGTLYAALMTRVSHAQFQVMVNILVGSKLVERDASHLLRWIGTEEAKE